MLYGHSFCKTYHHIFFSSFFFQNFSFIKETALAGGISWISEPLSWRVNGVNRSSSFTLRLYDPRWGLCEGILIPRYSFLNVFRSLRRRSLAKTQFGSSQTGSSTKGTFWFPRLFFIFLFLFSKNLFFFLSLYYSFFSFFLFFFRGTRRDIASNLSEERWLGLRFLILDTIEEITGTPFLLLPIIDECQNIPFLILKVFH